MWEEWDDEYFVRNFFDWNIFAKYFKDNEFQELEEKIKQKYSNIKLDELYKKDDKEYNDNVLLILHSFIEEKKYVDASDFLINIILRWNYYTSLRSEKELNLKAVKNRLKMNVDICVLPDLYNNFEEYFYSYFPLFLIETQQLINNKKENEDIIEYDVNIINDIKETYNYEFFVNISYDSIIHANIFFGDLVLLKFIPKGTAKNDSQNMYTPLFNSSKKKSDVSSNSSHSNENDKMSMESSSVSTDLEYQKNDTNGQMNDYTYDHINSEHSCKSQQNSEHFCKSQQNSEHSCKSQQNSEHVHKNDATSSDNNNNVNIYNKKNSPLLLSHDKVEEGTQFNSDKKENLNDRLKKQSDKNLKGSVDCKNELAKNPKQISDEINDDIYMVRKYCVRHLLGYVVSKSRENIKIKFNLNYPNFDIIDKVRKEIIYEIFNNEMLMHNYFIRISKLTSLISTLRLFNCLFNFRNSCILNEIVEGNTNDNEDNMDDVIIENVQPVKKRKRGEGSYANSEMNELINGYNDNNNNNNNKENKKHQEDQDEEDLDDDEQMDIIKNIEKKNNTKIKKKKDEIRQNGNIHMNDINLLDINQEELHNIQLSDNITEEYLKEKIEDYLKRYMCDDFKNKNMINKMTNERNITSALKNNIYNYNQCKNINNEIKNVSHIHSNNKDDIRSQNEYYLFEHLDENYKGLEYIPELLRKRFFSMYNKYQLRAINNSILNDGVTLIQGPPGTGKTTTILGIISALIFYEKDENIEDDIIDKDNNMEIRKTMIDENSYIPFNITMKEEKKSPYAWLNYDKNDDYCYMNDNCFDAMEYEDFHHIEENKEEEGKNIFHINKSNLNEKNDAYAIHLSIMNASNRTLKVDESVDINNTNDDDNNDVYKNNENRIKNLISLTESYYYSYVNNDHILNNKMECIEKNKNEKSNYSYYVSEGKQIIKNDNNSNYDYNNDDYNNDGEEKYKVYKQNKENFNFKLHGLKLEDNAEANKEYNNNISSYSIYNNNHEIEEQDKQNERNKMKKRNECNQLNVIKNKKILVCAPSNAAIDEILRRLISNDLGILDENGNFFNPIVTRIGGNVSTDLLEFSLEFKEQLYYYLNKKDENKMIKSNLLKTSTIICSTLSSSSNTSLINNIKKFDAIIIDESSQSVEIDILIPLSFACKKIILVGDPKQLSATVFSLFAKKHKYARSLFERLQKKYLMNERKYNLLSIQYRMHPEISAFPKKCYYKNKIRDAPHFLFTVLKELEISKYIKRKNKKSIKNDIKSDDQNEIDDETKINDELQNKYIETLLCNFNLVEFIKKNMGIISPSLNNIMLCQENQGLIDWFCIPLLQHSVFYDISFSKQKKIKNSYINIEESEVVIHFIEFLHYIFMSENMTQWYKRIGIITPYATEKFFLKKILKRFFINKGYSKNISNFIDVGTVDGFQGTEKDMIIFVCVRTKGNLKRKKKKEKSNINISKNMDEDIITNSEKKKKKNLEKGNQNREIMPNSNDPTLIFSSSSEYAFDEEIDSSNLFFSNYKRLNVALTRARFNLFIFGNCKFLKHCDEWDKIIEHYKMKNKIIKIKRKKFYKKINTTLSNMNEEELFDNNVEVINKKIENSFYNKNIIDYNFEPIYEKNNSSFDFTKYMNISAEEVYETEKNKIHSTDHKDDKNNIINKENVVDHKNEDNNKDIINFFKELYMDDISDSLIECDKENNNNIFQDDDNVLNEIKDNNIKEETVGSIKNENVFTEMIKNNDKNIYDEEKMNGGIPLYNEHIEDEPNNILNIDEMNNKKKKKDEDEESFERAKISSLSNKNNNNNNNKNNNIYYLKDNNYFIDTLFNYCKSNKHLHFAVQKILPNFSKKFLFNCVD
ncbi:DNA2/NAM7 helicase, putative [Plasmodium gaboni]|uniref:DNA2/NAM7 helicase, putative n=1 Tax=Plasmodium gaboni TaxID=647221 RepID=A0ABY1UNR5_9APIC|nr:DNA2/NAM7 helicase, putative [Plasmodium gaboni]